MLAGLWCRMELFTKICSFSNAKATSIDTFIHIDLLQSNKCPNNYSIAISFLRKNDEGNALILTQHDVTYKKILYKKNTKCCGRTNFDNKISHKKIHQVYVFTISWYYILNLLIAETCDPDKKNKKVKSVWVMFNSYLYDWSSI